MIRDIVWWDKHVLHVHDDIDTVVPVLLSLPNYFRGSASFAYG